MANEDYRKLKELIHTLLFLLSRQEFHFHQIGAEEKRLLKSIDKSAPNNRKMEHISLIREYELLMSESSWQLKKQQIKLQKYLELHPELKECELYQQADNVLNEMRAPTELINDN